MDADDNGLLLPRGKPVEDATFCHILLEEDITSRAVWDQSTPPALLVLVVLCCCCALLVLEKKLKLSNGLTATGCCCFCVGSTALLFCTLFVVLALEVEDDDEADGAGAAKGSKLNGLDIVYGLLVLCQS